MSYSQGDSYWRKHTRKLFYVTQIILLGLSSLVPMVLSSHASAAQITSRSATINKSNAGSTNVQFDFAYTLPTASAVQSITYNFCTTALGTCTLPTGLVANTGVSHVSQTGFPNNATAFAVRGTSTDSNNCLMTLASWSCYTRTEATSGSGAVTHSITGVTAPSSAQTVYIRITTYSDTAYLTAVDTGTVAVSFNNRYTINAKVQEALTFCVGNTTVDNATSQIVADCSSATGTSINLGNITSGGFSINPVAAANGGDGNNAYVMVSTNAQNGVTISYLPVQDTSSGKLKVVGASCSGTSTTDQCFNSVGASQTTTGALGAGNEYFGMTIGGTNCGSVPAAAYSCTFASGTHHLKAVSGYQGQGTFGSSWAYGTSNGFAYVDTNTPTQIATSGTNVVAWEALVLKYAAQAQVSTPTGVYQAQDDFIATPTF